MYNIVTDEILEKITEEDIKKSHKILHEYYEKYLKKLNVKIFPKYNKGAVKATEIGLLTYNYPNTYVWSKSQLVKCMSKLAVSSDPQYCRQAKQDGYCIWQSDRLRKYGFPRGCYLLKSLTETIPDYNPNRRNCDPLLKSSMELCRTCWRKEGDENPRYGGIISSVNYQHCNPDLPLMGDNCILQCNICNRTEQNDWVYNKKGDKILNRKCTPQQMVDLIKIRKFPDAELKNLLFSLPIYSDQSKSDK